MQNANIKHSAIGTPHNKVDTLLETSRKFVIGDREFTFNEQENIFFMESAINPRSYTNTSDGCNTCAEAWKSAKDLNGSHCHFCGKSSCKKCMTKTRLFLKKDDAPRDLTKSGKQIFARGSICMLCDRKFLVKEMVQGTLEDITSANTQLASALKTQEEQKIEIQDKKDKHVEHTSVAKGQLRTMKETNGKLKSELIEATTSSEDFANEIESSSIKQKMIQDQMEQLKAQIEQLEELVSVKIVNLKNLKEQKEDADREAVDIAEQLTKYTRTGRQPNNKRKPQKGRNRSFEESDEDDCGGKFDIPECPGKEYDGLDSLSPQTRDTLLEQQSKVKDHDLTVIMDEESQYFEDSELESQFDDGEETLATGKATTKKKKTKK